jgi:hypothetical protein
MSTRLATITSIGLITGEITPPTRSLRGAARAFATAATRFDEVVIRRSAMNDRDSRESRDLFDDEAWEPACAALKVAEASLVNAMEARGVHAVSIQGRLFVDSYTGDVVDPDCFDGAERVRRYDMGSVVAL